LDPQPPGPPPRVCWCLTKQPISAVETASFAEAENCKFANRLYM